ncbi:acetyl-CoA carboxylase biotin carboxyl carrier protein [Melioribacter sp. Ez-97]|uniref:acetyl-CoA carboxylase biotin carboxyl carrier protein n=1 Tax=Melioribacter sp. Ez-97 TaxID=3423434 RepID=UPI003ED8C152
MRNFKFTINGNNYDVEILNFEDNIAELEVNGTRYRVELEKKVQTPKTPKLVRSVAAPSTDIDVSTKKTSKPAERKGAGLVKSPLPGVILSVYVKEGDTVKIGDKLLTLEAMKMENNVNADKEGKITAVKVKPGDSVLEGDVLVEIGS